MKAVAILTILLTSLSSWALPECSMTVMTRSGRQTTKLVQSDELGGAMVSYTGALDGVQIAILTSPENSPLDHSLSLSLKDAKADNYLGITVAQVSHTFLGNSAHPSIEIDCK